MTGFSFPYVSAEGAGEYFEVSFAEIAEGEKSEECGHGNFPIDANLKITMADSSTWNAPTAGCAVTSGSEGGTFDGYVASRNCLSKIPQFVLQHCRKRPCVAEPGNCHDFPGALRHLTLLARSHEVGFYFSCIGRIGRLGRHCAGVAQAIGYQRVSYGGMDRQYIQIILRRVDMLNGSHRLKRFFR